MLISLSRVQILDFKVRLKLSIGCFKYRLLLVGVQSSLSAPKLVNLICKSVKKGEILPVGKGQWWWWSVSAAFLTGCQKHCTMVDVVNHKMWICSVPIPLSFLLNLLEFYVVLWNWLCGEQNAVLWNSDLSGLQQAGCHNPRATCVKSGTAASLIDNILSIWVEHAWVWS